MKEDLDNIIKSTKNAESLVVVVVSVDTEITWLVVSAWGWIVIVSPVFICEFFLTVERSSTMSSSIGKNVFGLFVEIV